MESDGDNTDELGYINRYPHSPRSGEIGKVLDPDNPLLEQFQKTLKEHLLRQIDILKNDIFENETEAKKTNAQREQLGIQIYEEQQIVAKQQDQIETYVKELETIKAAREEVENVLAEKQKLHRKKQDALMAVRQKDLELRREVEAMNFLIGQMSQWENTLESDITIKQRVYEKTRKDKNKLIEEKRFQDGLIYRLMTTIFRLENELDKMDTQMKVKEQEREEMAQTVAQGNTNIEAIATEYRSLMHSWNSVVVAIGNRDKIVSCLRQETNKLEENFKNVLSEIEKVKKLSQKEMETNQGLTVIKDRIQVDLHNCQIAMDSELAKRDAILREMTEIQSIVDQTEKDIQKVVATNANKKNVLNTVTREYEKCDVQKAVIEENILVLLDDQMTYDTAAINQSKSVRDVKARNREMEISIANCENKTSKIQTDIETQKWINEETQKLVKQVEEQTSSLEKEIENHLVEYKKLEFAVSRKQREMDLLNKKLYQIMERMEDLSIAPIETRIACLEKNNEDIQHEIKDLQKFWLREQTNLLNLSQDRQEQIQTNNLLAKQILILEQKNLRVTDELGSLNKQKEAVMRNVHVLYTRLQSLCDTLFKKKGMKSNLDEGMNVMRQESIFRLKDAEMECLQLEEELAEVENDKVNLSNELIDLNREFLEWERKLKLAKEAKETMSEEKSQEGELGVMRAEIHRMNVRYGQLKKAQDKLIHDLGHCVNRRDAMLTVVEAREKRVKGGMEKTRINFHRKLDDMRNKIKQMENEINGINEKIQDLESEEQAIDDEMEANELEIKRVQSEFEEMTQTVEEAHTRRQMNSECLVQLQRKLNLYVELSKNHKPYLPYKTESAITYEFNKQKDLNMRLTKIVENLIVDFPNHNHELGRILNTLKLPMFVVFSYN